MTRPRVTLLDVAKRAGVSQTTASFVMTGRRDMRISSDAEQRVLRAARELDYRPNLIARGLRTNLSLTIGLISDVIATEVFAGEMIRGSLSTALAREHLLFVGETQGNPAVEQQVVRSMLDRGVGGFVYAAMYTQQVSVSKMLRGQPLVLLNCLARSRGVPAIVPDEREGGRTAARALLDAGHTEGIYVAGESPPHVIAGVERIEGVREELSAAGVGPPGIIECLWWPEPAYEAIYRLLDEGTRPSAIICLNDRVALGAYQALREFDLGVPGDVSIVSFDDSDLASWLRPQLTSVAIPHFDLGRRAVEALLSDPREAGVQRVPMPLRERSSITAPAGRNARQASASPTARATSRALAGGSVDPSAAST